MPNHQEYTRKPLAVVVNDDATQLTVLAGLLQQSGIEARAFESAEEALAAMNPDHPPDIVVTDLFMPGIDGWKFCRLLRSPEYKAFNRVPLLVISATFSDYETVRISADLGADAFLPSPVNGKRFLAQVHTLIRGKKPADMPNVLLVEDSKAQAFLLKEAFESHGYAVDVVPTVAAAMDAFEQKTYDAAVLDYHLPGEKGDALLPVLQERRPDCVCIMITTDPRPELALEWMKKGASAYLRKPLSPEYLVELCVKAHREKALLRLENLLELRTRELRASEYRFRSFVENASDIVFSMTPEGFFTYLSPNWFDLTGEPAEESIGNSFKQYIHPEDIPSCRTLLRQLVATGEKQRSVEYRIKSRDGSWRWQTSSVSPLQDRSGNVISCIGIARDVTERKRAESALRALAESGIGSGEGIFHILVRELAVSLEVRYALLARIDVEEPDAALTLAVWGNGEYADNFSYDLSGTPCRNVTIQGPCFYARDIRHLFPRDRLLAEMKAESYCGTPLRNSTGKVIGILALLDDRPMKQHSQTFALLQSFAARAAAELERLQSDERLREREAFYRDMFQKNRAVKLLIEPDTGQIIDANSAASRFYQYSLPDLTRLRIWDINVNAKTETRKNIDMVVTGEQTEFEFQHRLASGEIRDVHVFSGMVESGKQRLLQSIVIDITARKQAEAALLNSEEKFRNFFEYAGEGIIISDKHSDILDINPAAVNMLGYRSAEDLIGKNAGDIIHPDDLDRTPMRNNFEQAASGKVIRLERRFRKADGSYLLVQVTIKFIGNTGLHHVLFQDITERKRAEAERERLLMAIEQSSEVIVITDAKARIQYVNPAFERLTGHTREDAIGRNPRILKSGEHDSDFYRSMWRTLTRGETWHGQFVNRRKDGSLFIEDATISPVRNASGRISNYVAVKRDITDQLRLEEERTHLEAQFYQAQKLESVGRLAGGVAHDLNNLLAPILGYGEMLLADDGNDDDGDGFRNTSLEAIVQAGLRARNIVRQLLAFSRKQPLEFKPVDLNQVLSDFQHLLRRTIREDVAIEVVPAPSLPLIRGDSGQLEQVIMNLAVNAQDAMPDGGVLLFETAAAELDDAQAAAHEGLPPGTYVLMAVSDTGFGMDADTREHLFEPFFTTKETDKGTGLGMATVYGIVRQHGGNIQVYSNPGEGATIEVYLPAAGEAVTPEKPASRAVDTSGTETILLVEDDEGVRTLTEAMLARQGYTVLTAENGLKALTVLKQYNDTVHLLLTDVIMPEMNGMDLFLHVSCRYPAMKVLYMSGYTDDVIGHHGIIEPGLNFIQKPFSVKDLTARVREMLDQTM